MVIGGAPAEVVDGGGFNHRHLGGAAPSGCVRENRTEKPKKPSTNVVAPVSPDPSQAEQNQNGTVSVYKRIWVFVRCFSFTVLLSVSLSNPLVAPLYTTTFVLVFSMAFETVSSSSVLWRKWLELSDGASHALSPRWGPLAFGSSGCLFGIFFNIKFILKI